MSCFPSVSLEHLQESYNFSYDTLHHLPWRVYAYVAAAVATLDERNRELIALRYGADLTAKQIAAVLGVRTNAVEVALHRALGRLRAELEAPAVDPAPAGKPLPTFGNS